MKKKHELIKKAYDGYPKGTKYRFENSREYISTGSFKFDYMGDIKDGYGYVYADGQWAEIVKPSDRKFVLRSEDGVDLYKGDEVHWIRRDENRYLYSTTIRPGHECLSNETFALFSTLEAAEAWIAEQNKPKEIILHQYDDYPSIVTNGGVKFKMDKLPEWSDGIFVDGKQLEEIYQAYKSLQGKEAGL